MPTIITHNRRISIDAYTPTPNDPDGGGSPTTVEEDLIDLPLLNRLVRFDLEGPYLLGVPQYEGKVTTQALKSVLDTVQHNDEQDVLHQTSVTDYAQRAAQYFQPFVKDIPNDGTFKTASTLLDPANDNQIILADPLDTSLPDIKYLPAFPTTPLADLLRSWAVGLGMPIVDTMQNLFLFRNYKVRQLPGLTEFASTRVVGQEAYSVTIQWYATQSKGHDKQVVYQATDVISLNAGETQEFTFSATGTPGDLPENITYVDAVPMIPYDGSSGSILCVTGSDGYVLSKARWNRTGGSAVVKRGTGPYDLIVTITAPNDENLSPYTITEGVDRPALYIVSNGAVTFNTRTTTVPYNDPKRFNVKTVAADPAPIDCYAVDTADRAYSAALRASRIVGTHWTFTAQIPVDKPYTDNITDPADNQGAVAYYTAAGVPIPLLAASKFYRNGHMWSINKVEWDVDNGTVQLNGSEYTTLQDFDDTYSGMTCAELDAVLQGSVGGNLSASEFNNAPLLVKELP